MTVFTIVDFKKGYWMVVLHPDSRKLTCMVLPFGRFQWTWLPMGTVVAQDIFQSKLDSIFIGMEGVTGIADDMVIAGRDEMEHDRNFLAFMEKCMNNNLTLNSEKIKFKQSQVSFYGHCWWKHRISPDPKKIQALTGLDKEPMRSFLGMINYLNRYSALSAHLTAPLSALTHQATDCKPGKVHFENSNQLKVEISNMKALPYFDVNAETTLQMDASKNRSQSMFNPEGKSHMLCFQGPHQDWAELPEFRIGGIRNYLGNGKVPLLLVWKGIYIGNHIEATRGPQGKHLKFPITIWLTVLSIFTLGGFGCLTPISLMWVSSSSWGGVWTRLALLVLFLDWHTLWKCPILWQSLDFAFLAGHFCPSWCSGFPHLMHFPSIPGGFLDRWLWFEDPCAPELFCSWFFPLAHFCLLLLPLFCLWSYTAKFMDVVESSWDKLLWWALQSSIASWFMRNSTVSSFLSSFIKFMALSLASWLFMPRKIASIMALSSASGLGNWHLFAIFTMWEWSSADVIEPCLAKCSSSTASNGFDLGASKSR